MLPLLAQEKPVSLSEVIHQVEQHALLRPNLELTLESTRLKIENLKKSYWPRIDLNGSVAWQNEVPGLDVSLPNFTPPKAPQDQYRMSVDLQQMLYDGGISKSKKELESASGAVEAQQIEVHIYALRTRVCDLYYLILRIQKQMEQHQIKLDDLVARETDLEAGSRAGTVLQSDRNLIRVEQLKMKQAMAGLEEGLKAACAMLGELTAGEFQSGLRLQEVQPSASVLVKWKRPELKLFELQRQKTTSAARVHHRNPQLYAFGQLGYGNPTYNMLNDQFGEFYLVGIKLHWNLWDWKQTGRQKQVFGLQREMVDRQELQFRQDVELSVQQTDGQIAQWSRMMEMDREIVALYEQILQVSHARWKNGTITATDYLSDLTRLSDARLAYEFHRIELARATSARLILTGAEL